MRFTDCFVINRFMTLMEKPKEKISQEKLQEQREFQHFCEQVAKTIGGEVTAQRVKRLIWLSNKGKHIFHGVKRLKYLEGVKAEGIMPLTPEGGQVSFWTSGQRLFGELKKDGSLQSYDSTFFHYGHTENDKNDGTTCMTIALSNAKAINQLSEVEVKDNDYLQIGFSVPREKISLLQVKTEGDALSSGRAAAQIAEQEMFKLIEDALIGGYELGGEKERETILNK